MEKSITRLWPMPVLRNIGDAAIHRVAGGVRIDTALPSMVIVPAVG